MGKRLINVDEVEEIVPVQVEEPEFLKFYNCHLEMIK
jgi:hypothetical protein